MKLPHTVRIGAHDYEIVDLEGEEAKSLFGNFASATQTIGMCPSFPSALIEADTFIHEVLHGLFRASGIKGKHGEESIVTALATGLVQVFRDNPTLLPWLEHKIKGTA